MTLEPPLVPEETPGTPEYEALLQEALHRAFLARCAFMEVDLEEL